MRSCLRCPLIRLRHLLPHKSVGEKALDWRVWNDDRTYWRFDLRTPNSHSSFSNPLSQLTRRAPSPPAAFCGGRRWRSRMRGRRDATRSAQAVTSAESNSSKHRQSAPQQIRPDEEAVHVETRVASRQTAVGDVEEAI